VIEFIKVGETHVCVRLDRVESIEDLDSTITYVRMMSGMEYKTRFEDFNPVRQRVLDYWSTLPVPIVNPGQEKG
jgi:hypothetical protein